MAIKRISDLSSILYDSINNNTSFTTIENLEISGGILRDIIPNKNDNNDNTSETNLLKESLFEISWPIKSDTISVGYTNFESRSISYETLSGYITHNILHETYTFVGNKKFSNNVTISGDISVGGNVYLGNDTSSDEIHIKSKKLESDIGEVTNNLGNVTNNLSGNLNITLTNRDNSNIFISNYISNATDGEHGRLDIRSNTISINTDPNNNKGYLDIRGFDTNISASDHIKLITEGTMLSAKATNTTDGRIFLSALNIEIVYLSTFTIKCGDTEVLKLGKNGNNPTISSNTSQTNPISGYINHALWS